MVKHYIIMSSSYTDGTRVALDITEASLLNSESISKIIQSIQKRCGKDVPLSSHLIETKSDTWASVAEYDPFFENVVCTKSAEDFSSKIKKSRVLSGIDVARYILTKIKCTHLSVQKLVYFSYADYLCTRSKRLFEDQIYAFRHGPIVESVYKTYKGSGYQYLNELELDTDRDVQTEVTELPARSRILFAEDGVEKLQSINQTIEKYGRYSARELVEITHRSGSPWSHTDSSKIYQIITDEVIMAHHRAERP